MIAGSWKKLGGKLQVDGIAALIEELNESGRRISRDVGLQPADLA